MMEETQGRINWPAIAAAAAVLVAAGGTWYWLHRQHEAEQTVAAVPAAPPAPAAPENTVQHPLAGADSAAGAPLPALADSDSAFKQSLGDALGAAPVNEYLVPEGIIRRIVVTVDNLPRQKVAVDKRPVVPTAGAFAVNGDDERATLDARNFSRYRPAVSIISNLDVKQVMAVYVRYYPLFQQAYQNLGYPNGYFNDRLVQAIDSLLATPDLKGPIEVTRPNVMYVYADPTLEARPAGQKLLMRMGPENEAALKAKLAELRAAVTANPPPKH